jgi:hypothetical protein
MRDCFTHSSATVESVVLLWDRTNQQPRLSPRPPASHSHAEVAEAGIQPLPQVVPIHVGISSGRFDYTCGSG